MRFIAIILTLLVVSFGTAHAQVVHDASGTAVCNINAASGNCTTLTIGSGTNRALVVYMDYSAGSVASSFSATWNSTNVPIVGSMFDVATDVGTIIFCLANPTSGKQTLAISITAASLGDVHVIGSSFTGVNQVTPCKNYTSVTGQVAGTASITVTSASGDMGVAVFGQGSTTIASTNGTTVGIDNSGPNISIAANYIPGAATVAMTSTAPSATWDISGADVAAASGGGGSTCNKLPLLGAGC